MRCLLAITFCVLGLALVTQRGFAQDKTGLKVGTTAPAFNLKDQKGQERSLQEFLKKGKVALVFYRSATW
jgi:cytochrome oxidase Cu insertion factor (SCO1/SenC/PrrC family)